MHLGQPEAPRRLTLGVELDDHRRRAPHHPRIVTRLDDEDARRGEVEAAAVRIFAANVAWARKPTWACMQWGVPTMGFMCVDQRKPGG